MTPISASDIAESLNKIPNKHADTVLAHLTTLSPRAAASIREHLDSARTRPLTPTSAVKREDNEKARVFLTSRSRRLPDHVTDTICEVLSDKPVGFNELFEKVWEESLANNRVSGGEEMMRLRTYEKLQNLVHKGFAGKVGKEYTATATTVQATSAWLAQNV